MNSELKERNHSVSHEPEKEEDVSSHERTTSDIETAAPKKSLVIRKTEIIAAQYDTIYHKFAILFCALLVGYGYGLDGNIRYVFTSYATSAYSTHSLLSTVNVIEAVVGAASQPVYARLSDVFGRIQLFVVAVLFYVVGTIIQSQSYDVQRYAGGSVLYYIGYTGIILVLLLILSDFSSLKWRLFYTFVPTFPFIINTWISGNITAEVGGDNWSWGIGMWAFIFPLSCIPMLCCMLHMRWLAGRTAEWKELIEEHKAEMKANVSGRGSRFVKFMVELFWKLDVIGLILLVASLGCLLVPLTLAGGVTEKWRHGNIIGPIVLGGVLIPIFIIYEHFFARFPIAPFGLIKDRGVWSALVISFLFDFIYYMACDYLYTVLIIAVNESTKSATRISVISSFVGVVAAPFYGLFIVKFKRLKGFIAFGCALWFTACGMLMRYRGGEESHSGIIGALCVMGLGTCFLTYPINVSLQSVTSHENMANVSSLCYTTYRIGAAVGSAVSGAIWTQTLYKKILEYMGDATLAASAYASPYDFILIYTWGTPEREALVKAYKYVQNLETLVAVVFCAPLFICSLFLRDPKLTDEQAKEELKDGEEVYKHDEDIIANWFHGALRKVTKKGDNEC
ncbi:hypothetical protein PACTADRAFT_3406 [Pachysolen tannophilus NRRL Y-2460]|uniref:Major facilitator superfamily (MFS) profile domain-containing protein n=1 Tax=Pachysolen tannophilus NRRL Y-2460 TaxID=669874 RepID=A0A1E4TVB5_PACTA|nr:hypothetical protein PACTADRAFT_3406 [Pachysolen tannophilus NRRL Y-2460]